MCARCPMGWIHVGGGSRRRPALTLSASISRAGIWREVLKFVRLPLPVLRVGRALFFDRNVWPDCRVLGIERQPFFKPLLSVWLDGVDRAFRHADAAIDAFVGMNDQHVLAFVEAVDRAHFDAIHDLATNAAFVDDVGQFSIPSIDRERELIPVPVVAVLANRPDQAAYNGLGLIDAAGLYSGPLS
jgi:hypothetical protein